MVFADDKRMMNLFARPIVVFFALSMAACTSFSIDMSHESDERWHVAEGDGSGFAGVDESPQPVEQVQATAAVEAGPAISFDLVTGAPQPNAYGFVVGIDEYRSVNHTPGARNDAEQFAELLQTTLGVPNRNIHLLTDGEATRSDILATLSSLQQQVDSDGRIYFFFSGHGTPEVESGESYLLPYEGRPETIEHSGISLDDILDGLEQTPARDVLAFVDACFSGSGDRSALPEGTRPLVPVEEAKPSTSSNVALLSSSGANEISGTTADGNQGLFTHHLIRAIGEGRADIDGDGQISLDELHTYITPRVARDARELDRNQTPSITASEQLGDPSNVMLLWGLPRD